MNTLTRLSAVLVTTLTCGLPVAQAADNSAAPAAAGFYFLTGDWKGDGSLRENGQPTKFDLHLQCSKASAGWAELCTMNGHERGGKMELSETDLFGVNPVTGKAHWYAVTNTGDTHDHLVTWQNPHTLHARLGWREQGRQMEERIELHLTTTKTMQFRSVVRENGHAVSEFTGALHGGS